MADWIERLPASGQATALRTLLRSEAERSRDFIGLANALSALCPAGTDEKRLVDAMLLARIPDRAVRGSPDPAPSLTALCAGLLTPHHPRPQVSRAARPGDRP